MKDFDVIVVGAGVGGCAAAIKLAQLGKNVLLLERGQPAGSKNLSGGVLWGNDLAEIIPNWQSEGPVERFVLNKKVGFLSEKDATVIDLHFNDWDKPPYNGSIVLRAKFDEWLANQAKDNGVTVLDGITVDRLLVENGKVVGIESQKDAVKAPITIIMDGANSRLTLEAGLRKEKKMSDAKSKFMLGLKDVLRMDKETIEERFALGEKQGVAGEFVLGNIPGKVKAGGFFYTNHDSISLGVVVHLDSLTSSDRTYRVLEKFKEHPYIQRLIKDGDSIAPLKEYGAKLIPEAGYNMMPQLYGDGFLVGGDAAGFVFSNGLVIQGMNYAIKSGILAADAASKSLDRNDYSKASLKSYQKLLENSYVLKDLKKFRNVTRMTKNENLFKKYPHAINAGFKTALTETGQPKEKLYKTILGSFKKSGVGLLTLMKDALRGGTQL